MGTRWYPATVLALHGDGRCDVAYDDGDREVGVLGRYVKPLPAALESALREAAEEAKQAKEEARACWRPPQMDSWRATDVPIGEGHQASLPDWEGPADDAPPTTAAAAERAAAAEGLRLLRSDKSPTGFKGVRLRPDGMFAAWCSATEMIGAFASPALAALAVARRLGREVAGARPAAPAAAEAAAAAVEGAAAVEEEGPRRVTSAEMEVELAVGIAAALTAAAYAEQREGFGDFFAGEDGEIF